MWFHRVNLHRPSKEPRPNYCNLGYSSEPNCQGLTLVHVTFGFT